MPTFTLEDLEKADGKNGRPLYFSLNGMVRQYIKNDQTALARYELVRKNFGPHYEFLYASAMYDPKYGLPKSINLFTREHSAYCEDLHADFINTADPQFKTVGFFN